jgi:CheY-like chemotaxis protein
LIGLTAAAGDDIRKQFMDAGADGYLTKPVSRTEIAQTLASLEKQLRHPAL